MKPTRLAAMYNHLVLMAAIDSTEAEYKARRTLDAANRTGGPDLIRKKTLALAKAEKGRREG